MRKSVSLAACGKLLNISEMKWKRLSEEELKGLEAKLHILKIRLKAEVGVFNALLDTDNIDEIEASWNRLVELYRGKWGESFVELSNRIRAIHEILDEKRESRAGRGK